MSQLKLFFCKLLLFTAFFMGTYSALLFAMTHLKIGGNKFVYRAVQGLVWKGGFSYDRFREFNPDEKYDILVFGSSRANRGIDPHSFERAGYSIYNLGTDDQTPINTCVMVKEFVKKNNCRLVLLDVYDKVFSQNPLESNSDLIQNLNNDDDAFKMTLAAGDLRAVNQFGVRLMLKNQQPEYKAATDLYKGFRGLEDVFHYSDETHLYFSMPRQLSAFEETLKYLSSIDVPCLITCQPLPKVPVKHDAFIKDIQPILKKYNLTLYDFTDNRSLVNPSGFADMSHLNSDGAKRYSDFLADSLVNKIISNAKQVAGKDIINSKLEIIN
ncbi:MAG: hypothetical protein ABI772_11195 [Bacteroidota bacterium]